MISREPKSMRIDRVTDEQSGARPAMTSVTALHDAVRDGDRPCFQQRRGGGDRHRGEEVALRHGVDCHDVPRLYMISAACHMPARGMRGHTSEGMKKGGREANAEAWRASACMRAEELRLLTVKRSSLKRQHQRI